jgi:hypothetical protein
MRKVRARQRAQANAGALAVDQQRDTRDGMDSERGVSQRMRMPHERDESAAGSAGSTRALPAQAGLLKQAHRDLARGLQDTDCRAIPNVSGSACPPQPRDETSGARVRSAETSVRAKRAVARRLRRPPG